MKEKVIEVTDFQAERLKQLEEGLCNVNNSERVMQFSGKDVLYIGDEDQERQIDREVLKGAKGGLRGIVSELIYEYRPDPKIGKDVRVKNVDMEIVVHEIISVANAIKNQ